MLASYEYDRHLSPYSTALARWVAAGHGDGDGRVAVQFRETAMMGPL
jgi:hypothetical protein